MSNTYSLRKRIITLAVIIITIIASVSIVGSLLSNRQYKINNLISQTIATDRVLREIELDYFKIMANTSSQYVFEVEMIEHTIDLIDKHEFVYDVDVRSYLDEESLPILDEFGFALIDLHDHIETGSFKIHDINELTRINDEIKMALIESIRKNSAISSSFTTSVTFLLFALVIGAAIFVHYQITQPLSKITKALRSQQDDAYDLQRIDGITVNNEIGMLSSEYNQLVKKNGIIREVNQQIYNQRGFDEIFDYIYDNLVDFIPYERIGVAVINGDGKYIEAVKAKSKKGILLPKGYRVQIDKTSLKNVIDNHEVRIINDLSVYLQEHKRSESTELIMKEGMRASITLPLFYEEKAIGVMIFSSVKRDVYNRKHQDFLMNIASALSVTLEKSFMVEDILVNSVKGFARIVESKDTVTGNHVDRMSLYSEFVAQKLFEEGHFHEEINEEYIRDIRRFSVLHDIGKVAIPDQILNKAGKLSDEEFRIMKEHSNFGAEVLKDLTMSRHESYFDMAVDIARYHHEKYNGFGYPKGLQKHEIPLSARIVAIADVFDALTSERPYKKAFTFDEAIALIRSESNEHFDPHMVNVVTTYQSEFKSLYKKLWKSEGIDIE